MDRAGVAPRRPTRPYLPEGHIYTAHLDLAYHCASTSPPWNAPRPGLWPRAHTRRRPEPIDHDLLVAVGRLLKRRLGIHPGRVPVQPVPVDDQRRDAEAAR